MAPRVSVVMAVKDYPKREVQAAIYSIMIQTMRDLEFVIVDYGSTDGTLDIIKSASERDPRINVIDFPGLTFTQALNVGVAVSAGEFIARQDADDLSHPQRLERQLRLLEGRPEVDVLGAGYRVVDTKAGKSWVETFEFDHRTVGMLLEYGCPFAHGTLIVRSEVFDEFEYDERMLCAQDYGLYLKILHGSPYQFFVMPDVLYTRWHTPGCVSEVLRDDQDRYVGYAKDRYGLGHSRRHKRMLPHVRAYWRAGDRVKRLALFIIIAFYDYRYWIAEYHKARARREYHGHY